MKALCAVAIVLLGATPAGAQVRTGIDVLEQDNFAQLEPIAAKHGGQLRLGILTNAVGMDGKGLRTVDVLREAGEAALPGMKVAKLFSPEHGLDAAIDRENVGDAVDRPSGLPVISLYGATDAQRRPSAQQLAGLDAVVIDLQDAGVRYWTFQTLMKYFLEASAKYHIDIVILDRPNPINGVAVQGPLPTLDREDYVNPHVEPMRPGMTMGELAAFFNAEDKIGASLTVVRMTGWKRADWYDETGLLWINPSPNLRSLPQALAYAGTALLEGTNVSVKGPNEPPFVRFGAP